MRPTLTSLTIRGFNTIRELKDFDPGRLTVLIGPNGAGKSNLLSFFRMLSRMLTPPGGLQMYVAEQGGMSSLLHDGPARTKSIEALLSIQGGGPMEYRFRIAHAAGDTATFVEERYRFGGHSATSIGGGWEANLPGAAVNDPPARSILAALRRVQFYQFSDTSPTSRVRNKWTIDDSAGLKEDAANLAAFLYRLQEDRPAYYLRIVETIRLVLPFFADFEFQPERGSILLRWKEVRSDRVFGSWQAADGMLRLIALVALLQQPEESLPDVLILDEPELGLHPNATEILVALLQSASHHIQVIVATQSVSLVDRFEPHDIVVVERADRESVFRRLDDEKLVEWREHYTLSELWEKNVLGDRPARR